MYRLVFILTLDICSDFKGEYFVISAVDHNISYEQYDNGTESLSKFMRLVSHKYSNLGFFSRTKEAKYLHMRPSQSILWMLV